MSKNCPHDYVPAQLGHSGLVCRWCSGTPKENAVLNPDHCEKRAIKDPSMKEPPALEPDAEPMFLVAMISEGKTGVIATCDTEGEAQKYAQSAAENNESAIFGVYQKIGTARLVRKVDWKGSRG